MKSDTQEADVFRYMHYDALNSVDTITDANGQAVERLSYDPFGKRRNINGAPYSNQQRYVGELTNRGYTGHEHMDNHGLIHMNARLYDPETARFLSADIYIQSPDLSQSHNRYAYVINNPLKYTDPSGHFAWIVAAIISIIVAVVVDNPIIQMIATIAASFFTSGAAAVFGFGKAVASFAAGFVGGALNSGTIEGAFLGGFTALLTSWIGHGGANGNPIIGGTQGVGRVITGIAHGVAQGVVSKLRGGSFRAGFAAGLVGHLSPTLNVPGSSPMAIIARTLYAGMWGGLASTAAGGSFKDGAFQAAMVHLFNKEGARALVEKSYEELRLRISAAAADPNAILKLSLSDTRIMAQHMYYLGLNFRAKGVGYAGAKKGADTFIRKDGFSSRTFEVDGARYYGGQVNYIGVGAVSISYGRTLKSAMLWNIPEVIGWNLGQFFGLLEGRSGMWAIHNVTDIPTSTLWAEYGSYYAQ